VSVCGVRPRIPPRNSVSSRLENVGNASDRAYLRLDAAAFVAAPAAGGDPFEEPLLLFLSPEGHVIRAWRGGAGAAGLGTAVRQQLGNPAYSEIAETK